MSEAIQNSQEVTVDEIEEARESLRRLLEVVAPDRNFEVILQGDLQSREISLKHKGGRVVNLSSFLPRKYKFQEADKFSCEHKEKAVKYPAQKVPYNGFLLSLFHEIGHAHQGRRSLSLSAIPEFVKSIPAILREYMRLTKIEAGKPKEERIVDQLPIESFLPINLLEKVEDQKAKRERGAWVFAFKQLRELNRQGFNVFNGFENTIMVRTYIDFHLASYEFGLRFELASRGERAAGRVPRYVKKY